MNLFICTHAEELNRSERETEPEPEPERERERVSSGDMVRERGKRVGIERDESVWEIWREK